MSRPASIYTGSFGLLPWGEDEAAAAANVTTPCRPSLPPSALETIFVHGPFVPFQPVPVVPLHAVAAVVGSGKGKGKWQSSKEMVDYLQWNCILSFALQQLQNVPMATGHCVQTGRRYNGCRYCRFYEKRAILCKWIQRVLYCARGWMASGKKDSVWDFSKDKTCEQAEKGDGVGGTGSHFCLRRVGDETGI